MLRSSVNFSIDYLGPSSVSAQQQMRPKLILYWEFDWTQTAATWDSRIVVRTEWGKRQDIKIKRFGGVLYWNPFTSLLSYSILRRVTANKKYFHNEKDQSVLFCLQEFRPADWILIRQNLFLHCCLILKLIYHLCQWGHSVSVTKLYHWRISVCGESQIPSDGRYIAGLKINNPV